ncbi:MAG: FtsK/SpoIIIE domain-containing protein [Bdellovibrionota bacterium]|nr:FtsK/SpoIIIE domain-containing protein [Bdellovibrionota bacterium]
MMQVDKKTKSQEIDIDKLIKNLKLLVLQPMIEVFQGIKTKRIPIEACLGIILLFIALVFFRFDYYLIKNIGLEILYPKSWVWFIYKLLLVILPFYLWGVYQTGLRIKVKRKLTKVFAEAGLKSALNRLPAYVGDEALDKDSRKLTIKLKGQTLKQIQGQKDAIQESLRVHIDDIKAERSKGIVDIVYSYEELEDNFSVKSFDLPEKSFMVGKSRSQIIEGDLADIPHLLVAGQTGMGKSTFLRQFITSLYLKNKSYTFELVDLKQGLEFQIFHNLPRVSVKSDVLSAIKILERLSTTAIEQRSKLFLHNKCKDIDTFLNIKPVDRKYPSGINSKINLNRHIIVIDEAFDLFMTGIASADDVVKSRRAASKIAAQGRAVGIHVVIATQRPDRYAVDPQMKANLTGKVCFRVANIATSNTILYSKIAAENPNVKGRAIWQSSKNTIQIQTPNLTEDQAKLLLSNHYIEKEETFNPNEEN